MIADVVARTLYEGIQTDSVTGRSLHKDGHYVWMETSTRVVRDSATGEPLEFVVVLRNVSERKALEEKLAALAMTDGLTGLANRRAFDDALAREWKSTLRKGAAISLLLLDVDHFKQFNDRYGHQVGDDCLRTVGVTLHATVRQNDLEPVMKFAPR